jgi:hypothetical protein
MGAVPGTQIFAVAETFAHLKYLEETRYSAKKR